VTLLQAVVLGIVQGVTEWLPISSTAHLLLVPWILDWPAPSEPFLVLVQCGTLLAVIAYFRRDLWTVLRGVRFRAPFSTPESRLGWWIVLGTVPAGAAGLLLHDQVRAIHGKPAAIAGVLLGATALLFLAERVGRRDRDLASMSGRDALLVGVAQAVALVPGVSRSAATISGGMLAGLDRASAARFSFLLSIPIMAGAGAMQLRGIEVDDLAPVAAGTAAAAIVGYATIHWLMGFLARRPLTAFAWYRIAAGLLLLGLALYRA
jgi:undecaprenyl-diphosphatase